MDVRKAVTLARRTTVATIVVTLVACTTQSDDTSRPSNPPSAESPATETLAPEPRTATDQLEGQDDVIAAVTSAGIRVVAADGSTAYAAEAPVAGVDVTEEDLAILAAEGDAHSGTPGADLDAMVATEVPLSAFLVGYARGAHTRGAELANAMLAGQDLTHPDQVIFPALVPLLFSADLAHAAGDPDAVALAPSAYVAGGLCSGVAEAIKRGINTVFDALHVDYVNLPKTGVGLLDDILQGMANLVVDGVNVVVEAGRKLIIGLAEFLIGEVLGVIAKVAAIASMIGQFLEYVRPVKLVVKFSPEEVTKGIEPNGNNVTATLEASTDLGFGNADWPPWFVGCAEEAGQKLPPLKPLGEHVKWELEAAPDILRESKPAEPTLGEGGEGLTKATWELVTGTEPAGLTGGYESTTATVRVAVERTKVRELLLTVEQMARSLLTGKLPGFIRKILDAEIDKAAATLLKGLVDATDLHTSKGLRVSYHEGNKPKPPKGRHETWTGQWHNTGYGTDGTFSMEVQRSEAKMTGSIQIFNSDCVTGGQLDAIVDGDQVQFGAIQAGHAITFQGQIKGNHVAGLWSIDAGCGGWSGTWQATITKAK